MDAKVGNDNNIGTKENAAWQSLDKVSHFTFQPGDKIAFRSGQTFAGTLTISASGSLINTITYTTYGGKVPAIINGDGAASAFYAYNKECIEIVNLSFTNFRQGEIKKKDLFTGMLIINEDGGTLNHIYFSGVKVYNVNSTYEAPDDGKTDQSRYNGGVLFYTKGEKIRSKFNDISISGCSFENLSRTGFNFRSDWDDRSAYSKFGDKLSNGKTDNWTPNTKVIFRNNVFKNIAGNGLIVRVAVDALIEKNLFDSCGKIISGNAVFNFNTDNTLYQYNEAKNTIYSPGETDARGIDSDYRTKHTIIQYNYLHNNGLGGVVATGGPGEGADPLSFNLNTIIRYNIIENNALQGAYFSGRVEGLEVYNNVFFADSNFNSIDAIKLNRWKVYPNSSLFSNNIFSFAGKNIGYNFTEATNVKFLNNLYFGILPPTKFKDENALQADPDFEMKGNGTARYKIRKTSPAIKSGTAITTDVVQDYFGNRINGNIPLNIGADQGQRN